MKATLPYWLFIIWIFGWLALPLGHFFLFQQIEPFYTLIYCFLWWPYIFVADSIVYRLRGRSILSENPREFIILTIFSIPVWMIFEFINLRLQNWYYVQALPVPWQSMLYSSAAFATVLPGVFETADLILGLMERERIKNRRQEDGDLCHFERMKILVQPLLTSRVFIILIAGGFGMLVLPMIWPRYFFPLVWGFAILLLDPICYLKKGRSLLGQLALGDCTKLVSLLMGGMFCGMLWEVWNVGARTKWIYTVPFFDELKLGEMPILGFLGFPVFALECCVIVNFLSLFRGGRHFENSRLENRSLSGMSLLVSGFSVILFIAILVIYSQTVLIHTVRSRSYGLNRFYAAELGAKGVEALRERHALLPHRFLRLKEVPPRISPSLYTDLVDVCHLAEYRGIGLEKAIWLRRIGIRYVDDLLGKEPAGLAVQINDIVGRPDYVSPAEAKVWIQDLKWKSH